MKLSSLGDVVHAMPAVQDLRRALPQAHIDWVVERAFAPVLARCAGLRRLIPCDLRRWKKSPWSAQTRTEWRAFQADLQSESYDAVLDLQGLTKSALIAWLARTTDQGRRYALGNRTEGSGYEAPTRWVADLAIELEPHVHAVERSRLLCAHSLGYRLEGPPVFGLQAQSLPSSAKFDPPLLQPGASADAAKPVVALVHGTSRKDKEWPLDAWIALGQRLNQAGFAVVLAHGSSSEKATSETIAGHLQDAQVWPSMALDVLIDTMAQCAGVIGVDSGLSHIAVALDLPHVQIYNFDTAWRTGIQNARQVCVFAQPHPALETVWEAWTSLGVRARLP